MKACLAVSGNVLDFQIYADLRLEDALKVMEEAFVKPVDSAAVAELHRRMDAAKRILWVFDNCGEIVFDRLFMEPYREKIKLAVRGRPAFNDVTRAELAESGYGDDFAGGGVIDNETGIPGVILDEAGDAMRKAFAESDLIICKGQGNFETMNELKGVSDCLSLPCQVPCRDPYDWRDAAFDPGHSPWVMARHC